jgi:hypothetical protein
MLSNSRTESAAAGASTKENPRRKFATGSAGLASVVRGSSRRIMIMRSRPANISLINRRHYLPRLLLTLSSKRQKQKQPQRFADVDRVTPFQLTSRRRPELMTLIGGFARVDLFISIHAERLVVLLLYAFKAVCHIAITIVLVASYLGIRA